LPSKRKPPHMRGLFSFSALLKSYIFTKSSVTSRLFFHHASEPSMSDNTSKEKILKARQICKATSDPSPTQIAFQEALASYMWGDDDGTDSSLTEKRARLDACADAVLAEAA